MSTTESWYLAYPSMVRFWTFYRTYNCQIHVFALCYLLYLLRKHKYNFDLAFTYIKEIIIIIEWHTSWFDQQSGRCLESFLKFEMGSHRYCRTCYLYAGIIVPLWLQNWTKLGHFDYRQRLRFGKQCGWIITILICCSSAVSITLDSKFMYPWIT